MKHVLEVNKTETPAASGKEVDIEAIAGLRGDDHSGQVRVGYFTIFTCIYSIKIKALARFCKAIHRCSMSRIDVIFFPNVFTEFGFLNMHQPAWRRFLRHVGPGFMVSLAYLDPGNCTHTILSLSN
jgi:hypothetical protein